MAIAASSRSTTARRGCRPDSRSANPYRPVWPGSCASAADRLERAPALRPDAIRLSPADAVAALGDPSSAADIRLNSFDGRPAYRIRTAGIAQAIVYADTGERQSAVPPDMTRRIAAQWTGQPADAARAESIT